MHCNSIESLMRLENCVSISGNLKIVLIEKSDQNYKNISFPLLREITGFLLVYRIYKLESLGQLLPNLARIRGNELMRNYALVVHDMPDLKEIGLYSLVKIDRGGVIIRNEPITCYIYTVDWKTIAPKSRHVLSTMTYFDSKWKHEQCHSTCRCSDESTRNYCWNHKKCQRFLTGLEAEKCHDQCLGCSKTKPDKCSVCKYHTYQGNCVSSCPNNTVVLKSNQYCLNMAECHNLGGWAWNLTCVFRCPVDFVKTEYNNETTCVYCNNCSSTCRTQEINTIEKIQSAGNCVRIDGSLIIHLRVVFEAMDELNLYLHRIEEVTDYIYVYGSLTITSLNFLPSLRKIGGRKLRNNRYSLIIHSMPNLQSVFSKRVTNHLRIKKGTLALFNNPSLCSNEIVKLMSIFPTQLFDIDVAFNMNGLNGNCRDLSVKLEARSTSETSALITFVPHENSDITYSLLYVRVPLNYKKVTTVESCSNLEWLTINLSVKLGVINSVELKSLEPASTYAVCIESYDSKTRNIAQSMVINFTTAVGKPPPPFITELVASSHDTVVLRWLDIGYYRPHISYYKLYVQIVLINPEDTLKQNHCLANNDIEFDSRDHAVVLKPPKEYGRACESICGVLSTTQEGSLVQELFEVLQWKNNLHNDNITDDTIGNTTISNYVKTIALKIQAPKTEYQVGGLAPYHDYRFRLQSCTKEMCSGFFNGIVRTLPNDNADRASILDISISNERYLDISWNAPQIINGVVLAYHIYVIPKNEEMDFSYPIPQIFCVLNNITRVRRRVDKSKVYLVMLCTLSMSSKDKCTSWHRVESEHETYSDWWYSGVIVGVLIWVISAGLTLVIKKRRYYSDVIPLIDSTEMYRNLSNPPNIIESDFDFTPINLL